jgi:hypothetical protein
MTRQDTTTRRVTTAIVLAVGLFAGGDSYTHIYDLARGHGQDVISAALLPLAGDGMIAAASAVMLVASRQGRNIPLLARVVLLGGIAATAAANVAYGLADGLTGALLSIWPVAAYIGCMELLTWLRANTQPKTARTVPAGTGTSTPASTAAGTPDELSKRRKTRQPATDLLASAERVFPGGKTAGGKFPSVRDIRSGMGIGQDKARQVQEHFRSLPALDFSRTLEL